MSEAGGPDDTANAPPTDSITRPGRPSESWTEAGAETLPDGGAPLIRPEGRVERYVDLGLLARGGMSEVRRVHDRHLGRPLVMKVMDWRLIDRPEAHARFLSEAHISARLQHPGIVAVQDVGALPDGRLWFTMKQVDGRTLGAVVAAVHGAARGGRWVETEDGWSLRRLIEALLRVVQTVAYAHGEGVVHRDLKPDNIMIGAFGEVMVMDWGIARALDAARPLAPRETAPPDTPTDTPPTDPATTIIGTPAYMAPEQARGQTPTAATDVYALGGVLYHVLAGAPPLRSGGNPLAVLLRPPPRLPPTVTAADGSARALPPALVAVCHRALMSDPAQRSGMAAFADGLRAWLDGEAQRAQSRALVDEARAMGPEIERLRVRAAAHDARARALLEPLAAHAPIAEKRPAWDEADAAVALRRRARALELALVHTLRGALEADPTSTAARALLNTHYRERLLDAERRRDPEAAADATAQLRLHDPAGNAEWLRGQGRLTLLTDPPGATVALFRLEERDRRRVPVPMEGALRTPLRDHPLPRGHYLLVLRAPGRVTVRYPVAMERGGDWHGIPPGGRAPRPIVLPPVDEIGPDAVYVPPSWGVLGGVADAADGLPRQRVWLDGFVMQRHPVTLAGYRAFLDGLRAAGRVDEALGCVPAGRTADGPGLFRLTPDGFAPGVPVGFEWDDDLPVFRMSWQAARACAAWRAARDGLPWRLPESLEWERAARGVDERRYAMGDHLDPAFACVAESHRGPPAPAPVTAFELDESVYGVRGLTGNVRDFCATAYRRAGAPIVDGRPDVADPAAVTHRIVRGGAFPTQRGWCGAACRFAVHPTSIGANVGIRLVRSLG